MASKIAVKCGKLLIGGGNTVLVQSMTNTDTTDIEATLCQIDELKEAGCELVRVSVPTREAAEAFKQIVLKTDIPICADIHFSVELAIKACEYGAAKVRINPGNIPFDKRFDNFLDAMKDSGAALRIGVNGGSLKEEYRGLDKADAMIMSARKYVQRFENAGFYNIVLSAKDTNILTTIEVNRRLFKEFPYPIHIGITEAGTYETGLIKNSVGIGALLLEGIGDTIRYSLSANPVHEVIAARKLLNALKLRNDMAEVIACPTCARTEFDVMGIAEQTEKLVRGIKKPLKIAVMGCVVNGIGEGRDADFGIAGGKEKSVLFVKGQKVKTVENDKIIDTIKETLEGFIKNE